MSFEPATEADIPTIMEIERTPGYENFIGTWSAEEHLARMRSPDARYIVWRERGEVLVGLEGPDEPVVARGALDRHDRRDVGFAGGLQAHGRAFTFLITPEKGISTRPAVVSSPRTKISEPPARTTSPVASIRSPTLPAETNSELKLTVTA